MSIFSPYLIAVSAWREPVPPRNRRLRISPGAGDPTSRAPTHRLTSGEAHSIYSATSSFRKRHWPLEKRANPTVNSRTPAIRSRLYKRVHPPLPFSLFVPDPDPRFWFFSPSFVLSGPTRMGNVPAKEQRPRAASTASHSTVGSAPRTARRRATLSLSVSGNLSLFSHKGSKNEDKWKNRERHFLDLVVRHHECCDGGYLAPLGIYKLNLDYDTTIVRQLIVARKLAPFYTPLQDFDSSWLEDELVLLVQQTPLHAPDAPYSDSEEDDADNHKIHKLLGYFRRQELKRRHQELLAKTRTAQAQCEADYVAARRSGDLLVASRDLVLRLYGQATECPICFLYFPPHLNRSRCCRQPICSECFVQIKRLDPHPPHDHDDSELPQTLISEYACCPFCAMPNFGVTYEPPRDIHVGIGGLLPLQYVVHSPVLLIPEACAVDDPAASLAVDDLPASPQRHVRPLRRRSSVAADAEGVVTTDMIRPDWEQKLSSAISKLARKSATASVIHASNLILDEGSSSAGQQLYLLSLEDRMIREAMRLSLLDKDEGKKTT